MVNKKYNRTRDGASITKILIDKMLEHTDCCYDDLLKNPDINAILWNDFYTWTQQQSDEYYDWYTEFYYTQTTPRPSKKLIKDSIPWFNLQYGLKIKENE